MNLGIEFWKGCLSGAHVDPEGLRVKWLECSWLAGSRVSGSGFGVLGFQSEVSPIQGP